MPTTTKEVFPQRVQLEALSGHPSASVGVTVKNGFPVKQGDVIGKITASGLYRRRSRTLTAGAGFSNASTQGVLSDASVFAPNDVLKKTDGTLIGTIAPNGVNTLTNTVTLNANAAINLAAGNDVVADDGSKVAMAIADAETDGTADTPIAAIICGVLVENRLRGLDASAKAELAGASVASGIFKF